MADPLQRCIPFFVEPYTGLYDRPALEARLHEEILRACRYQYPLSLMLIAFDTAQSQQAVEWMPVLAEVLKRHTRRADVLACYGSDALALLLPFTGEAGALRLAARIRHLGQVMQPPASGKNRPAPMSIGVASVPDGRGVDRDIFLERARRALREAQQEGGDRIVVASPVCVADVEENGCSNA